MADTGSVAAARNIFYQKAEESKKVETAAEKRKIPVARLSEKGKQQSTDGRSSPPLPPPQSTKPKPKPKPKPAFSDDGSNSISHPMTSLAEVVPATAERVPTNQKYGTSSVASAGLAAAALSPKGQRPRSILRGRGRGRGLRASGGGFGAGRGRSAASATATRSDPSATIHATPGTGSGDGGEDGFSSSSSAGRGRGQSRGRKPKRTTGGEDNVDARGKKVNGEQVSPSSPSSSYDSTIFDEDGEGRRGGEGREEEEGLLHVPPDSDSSGNVSSGEEKKKQVKKTTSSPPRVLGEKQQRSDSRSDESQSEGDVSSSETDTGVIPKLSMERRPGASPLVKSQDLPATIPNLSNVKIPPLRLRNESKKRPMNKRVITRGKKDGDVERWYQLREIEEQWYSDGDNFQVPFKYLPSVEEYELKRSQPLNKPQKSASPRISANTSKKTESPRVVGHMSERTLRKSENDLDTSYKNMPASVRERDFDRSGKVSFGRLSGDEDTRVVQMTNPQQKSMAALMDRWNVRKVPDREMMEWEKSMRKKATEKVAGEQKREETANVPAGLQRKPVTIPVPSSPPPSSNGVNASTYFHAGEGAGGSPMQKYAASCGADRIEGDLQVHLNPLLNLKSGEITSTGRSPRDALAKIQQRRLSNATSPLTDGDSSEANILVKKTPTHTRSSSQESHQEGALSDKFSLAMMRARSEDRSGTGAGAKADKFRLAMEASSEPDDLRDRQDESSDDDFDVPLVLQNCSAQSRAVALGRSSSSGAQGRINSGEKSSKDGKAAQKKRGSWLNLSSINPKATTTPRGTAIPPVIEEPKDASSDKSSLKLPLSHRKRATSQSDLGKIHPVTNNPYGQGISGGRDLTAAKPEKSKKSKSEGPRTLSSPRNITDPEVTDYSDTDIGDMSDTGGQHISSREQSLETVYDTDDMHQDGFLKKFLSPRNPATSKSRKKRPGSLTIISSKLKDKTKKRSNTSMSPREGDGVGSVNGSSAAPECEQEQTDPRD